MIKKLILKLFILILNFMDPGLEPHHPSGYCDRHPEEQFIGYCPECLYEELTVHDENSSTSTQVESHATSSVGLYLPKPIFSHGQLYVALSRVKSKKALKF